VNIRNIIIAVPCNKRSSTFCYKLFTTRTSREKL